jgi:hypothetical protein
LAHFTTKIETRASAETAFSYLADFANCEAWDPSVSQARKLTPDPIGEGSRFEVCLPFVGRELCLEYTIRRCEPDRILVLEAESDWLRSLDTIEIERRPIGCRIHYDADLRPHGLAYLLDLPLHVAFQVTGARSARGLARALDRLAARPPTRRRRTRAQASVG